jgi:5-methylcytosine-specific restriction enzyme subunit McrC
MSLERVVLIEGVKGQLVDFEVGALLQSQNVCDVSLGIGNKASVSNFRKIGFISTDRFKVEIQPKVKIASLLQLLDSDLRAFQLLNQEQHLSDSKDWTYSLAVFFALQLEKSFSRGPLEGYVTKASWEKTIRGKIQFSQLATSSRVATPELPLEYDEFSRNIPENVIANTAIEILVRNFHISDSIREGLRRNQAKLEGVDLLQPGARIPAYSISSLNSHYETLLATSELIIRSQAISAHSGQRVMNSFLIDMARLFETYLEISFAKLSKSLGLDFKPQKGNQYLDETQFFRIRPDYLWFKKGSASSLADAKYKVIQSRSDVSNQDVNQIIAYCSRFGLESGHLVYASTPEFEATMTNSEIRIEIHEVDLSLEPAVLEQKVESVFRKIVGA